MKQVKMEVKTTDISTLRTTHPRLCRDLRYREHQNTISHTQGGGKSDMIQSIAVTNHLNDRLVIDLKRPSYTKGFYIKKITGLEPVKANINISDYAIVDGELSTQQGSFSYCDYIGV